MPRPLLQAHVTEAFESDDSGAVGGLADVLEPDLDAIPAISMRRPLVGSRRRPAGRRAAPPRSSRAPAPRLVQDFAFADTVVANELPGDEPPPSGPIVVTDPAGPTQYLTPIAYPPPGGGEQAPPSSRMGKLVAGVRRAVLRSREETRELWAGTAEMVCEDDGAHGASSSSFPLVFRRALALWSCFQWSRADLTRATTIGLAVFVAAAALGALAIGFGGSETSEVRAPRTVEQHTGAKIVVRTRR
jgi:hypothetical protein